MTITIRHNLGCVWISR